MIVEDPPPQGQGTRRFQYLDALEKIKSNGIREWVRITDQPYDPIQRAGPVCRYIKIGKYRGVDENAWETAARGGHVYVKWIEQPEGTARP